MDALDLMLSRESALKLAPPGPSDADLQRIFETAVRAPDHGRLRPWQFIVIGPEQRAAFGQVMADSLRRQKPDAPSRNCSGNGTRRSGRRPSWWSRQNCRRGTGFRRSSRSPRLRPPPR